MSLTEYGWDKKKNGKIGNVSIRGWNEEKRFVWRYPCFNLKSKEAYGRPRSGRDVVQPNELTRMRWRERIMFVRRTGLSAPEKLETTTITRLVSREQRINQREASFLTYRNWDQNNWRQINRFIFYLVFFIISSDLSYHLTSSNYTEEFSISFEQFGNMGRMWNSIFAQAENISIRSRFNVAILCPNINTWTT